jgi:hypothetical protein
VPFGVTLVVILVGVGSTPGSHCIEQEQPTSSSVVFGYREANVGGDPSNVKYFFDGVWCINK